MVKNLLSKDISTERGGTYNLNEVIDHITVAINVHSGVGGAPYSRSSTVSAKPKSTKQTGPSVQKRIAPLNKDQKLHRKTLDRDFPIQKAPEGSDPLTGRKGNLSTIRPYSYPEIDSFSRHNESLVIDNDRQLEGLNEITLYQSKSKNNSRTPVQSDNDLIFLANHNQRRFDQKQSLCASAEEAIQDGSSALGSENAHIV